ncbi:transporter [Cohnella candidum]|uniref:Transporter n=1 Tax=Cohnella candidum TaxID=2674991 RepID=A0A3G3K1Q2_9BACL|nr:transporter [Cohnella candidum]AYQ74393.1 transporter [Cohnella candidum]
MAFMPPLGTPAPTLPPPDYIPVPPYGTYIVDCLQNYTYVWLVNGESFWFYPTRVEYGEVAGYRWNGAFWYFYGIDPRFIDTVSCPPIPTLY